MKSNSMIRLVSPNLKSDELVFYWQQNAKVATEENKYIINTIHWVIRDVDELRHDKDLHLALDKIDLKSYSSVKELSETFNRKLTNLREEWAKGKVTPSFINRRANKDHLHHILDYCYGRAVDEPDKLNQYVPFSAEVYGETSFELVDQIIEWVKFRPDDVFIDLGSGVGQVVLQVAATTDCRSCCGIEKADYPTKCALILDQEFRKLMLYFGKPFNHFTLIKGDFLCDDFQETISNSTVIFANNFAFGPQVDHQLKNIFTSLKEGAKIISSKAFCPLKFRITDRNLDDIGSIMRVTSLRAMENAVSWTCTAFSYYLHQVDHSMLEEYFAKYKQTRETVTETDGRTSQRLQQRQQCKEEETSPTMIENMVPDTTLDQSLDHQALCVKIGRPRQIVKSGDCGAKTESPGRRASERLLRHSKKRPVYNEDGPEKTGSKRGRLSKRAMVNRSRSRSTDERSSGAVVATRTTDENVHPSMTQGAAEDSNRANIDQLYRTTMDTINGKVRSVNGGPDMTRFLGLFEPRELSGPDEALRYAATTSEDINVGQSSRVVPVAVHEYLELVKHRIMSHIGAMQSPGYRRTILSEIDNQMALRDRLSARVLELESQIPRLHREGVSLLSDHLQQLGIEADSPSSFFSEARKLIRDQAKVETDNSRLKKEIGDLLTVQKDLRDRIREQEAARDHKRHQEALHVLRNNQMIEHLLMQQQQQQYYTHNVLTNGTGGGHMTMIDGRTNADQGPLIHQQHHHHQVMPDYTSLYSPISKASSPDISAANHNPSL